jgi:hypothetical protein
MNEPVDGEFHALHGVNDLYAYSIEIDAPSMLEPLLESTYFFLFQALHKQVGLPSNVNLPLIVYGTIILSTG